jgi:hypothetical protein
VPTTLSIVFFSAALDCTPRTRATSFPPLIMSRVGMAWTPYFIAVRWFSSVLSLAKRTFPSYSVASCSTTGAMARHGPHHGAQKSTSTGCSALSTLASKSLSDTSNG